MLVHAAPVAVDEATVREGQPLGGHDVVANVPQRAQVVQRQQAHQVWPQPLVHFKDDQRRPPWGAAQQPLGTEERLVLLHSAHVARQDDNREKERGHEGSEWSEGIDRG